MKTVQLPKTILFLGSNIGNFSEEEAIHFLNHLSEEMNQEDQLFVGFDLKKNPRIIKDAYDDPHGLTAAFNLNLLTRINNELGGNFELENFQHNAVYNPETGTAKSYLVSKVNQTVNVEALETSFEFNAWEAIHTEISQKYDERMIESIAVKAGLKAVNWFYDKDRNFVNVILQKN